MRHLISILFCFLFAANLMAQMPKVKNLQRFDQKRIHFGFSLGINSASFALQRQPFQTANDTLTRLDVVDQAGFSLGIVTDLHLHPYFNVRFLPTLVFGQRNLEYHFSSRPGKSNLVLRQVESTYLDFPILFKYRSARLNNFAAYVIAGGKYSIDLASNEDVLNEEIGESIVKLKRNTTAVEVGVGTDFFLPYFKFSVELKMSYGLQNVLIRDNTELSNPVDRIIPKMFFVSFLFEG